MGTSRFSFIVIHPSAPKHPSPEGPVRPDPGLPSRSPGRPWRGLWAGSIAASGVIHLGLMTTALALVVPLVSTGQARATLETVQVTFPNGELHGAEHRELPELVEEYDLLPEELVPIEPAYDVRSLASAPDSPLLPDPQIEEPAFLPVEFLPSPLDRLMVGCLAGRVRESKPLAQVAPELTPAEPLTVAEPLIAAEPESRGAAVEGMPQPIPGRCLKPAYPQRAELRRWQGEVVCRITVAADGSVVGVKIQTSSGHKVLDDAALEGLKLWHFVPGTRGGVPQEMDVLESLHFQLDA